MIASAELHRAFYERADGVVSDGRPLIGLFGDSFPEALIASSGAVPIDVKAPPISDAVDGPVAEAVRRVVENFMDDFTARFLHRLATGAFDRFDLILFARDDVAGLTAYQYAQELRRQGDVSDQGPEFHLWNFLHTDSAEVARFNRIELDKLTRKLNDIVGLKTSATELAEAIETHNHRGGLLNRLEQGERNSFIWRNAGRWMPVDQHIALLERVVPETKNETTKRKIGIAGTACDLPVMQDICGSFGAISVEIHQYGQLWPTPINAREPAEMLKQLVRNPFHIRTNPAGRFTDALVETLGDCEIVLLSVDRNDDSFGWELPVLRQRLEPMGATVIDLGFRPFRPDADWIARARDTIKEALT